MEELIIPQDSGELHARASRSDLRKRRARHRTRRMSDGDAIRTASVFFYFLSALPGTELEITGSASPATPMSRPPERPQRKQGDEASCAPPARA